MKVEVTGSKDPIETIKTSLMNSLFGGRAHSWIGMHFGHNKTAKAHMGSSEHVRHMTRLKKRRRATVRRKMAAQSRRVNQK